jgi:hypothetical protein
MLVFPFYAGVQSLVMPSVGVYTYVRLAHRRRRLGRYRFGYRRGVPALRPPRAARAAGTRRPPAPCP